MCRNRTRSCWDFRTTLEENRGNTHFIHFLNISLGSSFELQTQLLIANQYKYITDEKTIEIENKIIKFQKMTTDFISKLNI